MSFCLSSPVLSCKFQLTFLIQLSLFLRTHAAFLDWIFILLLFFLGRDDFDANVKRVNLRSFRKTIEKYLEDSKGGGKLITFLEIDDSSDNMDVSECMQENPAYTIAIHENLRGKNQNFSKTTGKNLEEIITKDKIDWTRFNTILFVVSILILNIF